MSAITSAYRRVYIVCPSGHVSGGPDALHHLVHAARSLGVDAYISYAPFNPQAMVPELYRRLYDTPIAIPVDHADDLVLVPETSTKALREFAVARKAVWWLSLDNFFGSARSDESGLRRRRMAHDLKSVLGARPGRLSWRELRAVRNFSPSIYVSAYLKPRGILTMPLRDPVAEPFFEPRNGGPRENAIAFNPAKSGPITAALIKACREFDWIAIEGLEPAAVAERLSGVKLYVDFGGFPGRERLPREAILSGACLVTGVRGASAGPDVPIPTTYKLDPRNSLVPRFKALVHDIFDDFDRHRRAFETFRKEITTERTLFFEDIRAAFGVREGGGHRQIP